MARKQHLAALTDDTLKDYTAWIEQCLEHTFVDYPQWLVRNIHAELASCLAEGAMRSNAPRER